MDGFGQAPAGMVGAPGRDARPLYEETPFGKVAVMGEGGCSRCGECCSEMLPVTAEELAAIKEYIEERGIEPRYQSAFCPFLDLDTRLCRIYEARPTICRICDCRQYRDGSLFTAENKEKMKFAKTVNMTSYFYGGNLFERYARELTGR